MSEKVLLRAWGILGSTSSFREELKVTDRAVYGEILKYFRRIKMTLPYDRIAQVNIVRYVLGTDIEIVNKGGADNLIIHGLSKSDAERAKLLIEEHIRIAPPASPAVSNSIADEITKLAALRDRNLLTDAEFQIEKQKLLRRSGP
jgi:hypothetical protein